VSARIENVRKHRLGPERSLNSAPTPHPEAMPIYVFKKPWHRPYMPSFQQRLQVGLDLELRVADELRRRGWDVDRWGQATLSVHVQHAISRTTCRNMPDLMAARDGDAVAIDAKNRISSTETGRFAISRTCVSFGIQFVAAFGVPIFYVFGNLGVLTPQEVMSYGHVGPRGMGGSYYLVNGRMAHQFDDVFGSPQHRDEAA
jgi:hypothetical protein